MTTVEVFAPAKINLTLHVTSQRADGYHLLDSLVAFAGVGDRLVLRAPGSGRLDLDGPEARHLSGAGENLISVLAQALPAEVPRFDCTLHKHLPLASGMGGGSADAAAYYRGACSLVAPGLATHLQQPQTIAAQWRVGADVPMCIHSQPARTTGIGEEVSLVDGLPPLAVVLVNPRQPVPTGAVFNGLASRENAPMTAPEGLGNDPKRFLDWLGQQRNDLQDPAVQVLPLIGSILDQLAAQEGCALARMSGSGATCFGLFEDTVAAEATAARLSALEPGWWVRATSLNGHLLAAPQVIRSTT